MPNPLSLPPVRHLCKIRSAFSRAEIRRSILSTTNWQPRDSDEVPDPYNPTDLTVRALDDFPDTTGSE